MRIVGAVEAVGKGARTCRLFCGLLSIRELSGMDRLYRTRKRWARDLAPPSSRTCPGNGRGTARGLKLAVSAPYYI